MSNDKTSMPGEPRDWVVQMLVRKHQIGFNAESSQHYREYLRTPCFDEEDQLLRLRMERELDGEERDKVMIQTQLNWLEANGQSPTAAEIRAARPQSLGVEQLESRS